MSETVVRIFIDDSSIYRVSVPASRIEEYEQWRKEPLPKIVVDGRCRGSLTSRGVGIKVPPQGSSPDRT